MNWYRPVAVPTELADDLVTGWTAQVGGAHRLVPDGCVDVLWIDGGRLVLCGPETSAWSFQFPAGTAAVGVRFQPGRAGSVFGLHTAEIRDRRVELDALLGSRDSRQLAERIDEADGVDAKLAVLGGRVRSWLTRAPSNDPIAAAVAELLRNDPSLPVGALAERIGVGARQLHRRCLAAFGYGPATLRRILRLQRFLRLARQPGAPVSLAGLAVLAGYTDQPHLSHDCRELANASPRELVGRTLRDDIP
ncbi:AraC family transcriptional regulator [Tamaricihabitans halophyticus]|uniref:AraC family transcriptional regulator n=1 Tax=Tamaricihabitans halophyticus TaxID=1262583 RepID=A0A4R2QQN9_9PSEU|nr:helix-turn-helix domain-containing protein [Tamaricihabitans halophyticus]TCP52073.1 AraC family transcriptional regulator [Tamaricihabitans halophyticus]